MKKVKDFIKQKSTILQLMFVASVLILVLVEISKIIRDVDWNQVSDGLLSQSIFSIIMMLILGMFSVTPMLIYDISITSFLSEKFNWKYILKSGWITNTFTNIAGFGGILGATLRASFYGKKSSKKQVLYAISKIALFLLAGLSIYCWVSLFIIFGLHIGSGLTKYWIWLVGGGLYFPLLFSITKFKNNAFFGDLTLKKELFLIMGSCLEWAGAGLFFIYIGLVLGVKFNILEIFALYIIASVFGVISMVPGGLGSFDVFIILGMESIGIGNADVIVWLLFFRIFYYIVPFFVGTVLFVHTLGNKVNEYFDGIPSALLQKTAHILITIFMYASGIIMLIEAAVPSFAFSNFILVKLYPLTFLFLHQMTDVIFAFLLIAMGRGFESRVKKSFWPTIIVLGIGIVNTLWRVYTPGLAWFLIFIMACVILSRKELYREQLRYSFGKMFVDGGIFTVTFLLYLLVGFLNFRPIGHKSIPVPEVLIFQGQQIWLSGFMGMILAGIIMLIIITSFTSDTDPFRKMNFDKKRIKKIIDNYSGNEVSHLAFLRDKNIYYYRVNGEDIMYFMYRRKNDKLIFMGEPVGNMDYLKDAIKELMTQADYYGYELVFYEINSKLTMLLHDLGFDFIKNGEEGYVTLKDFSLSGKKKRGERALINKFEREGYTFEMIEPPFSKELIQELKQVSDSWLDGQLEKGFSLGFFDEYYLNQANISIIKDADNKIVAFASMMPMDDKTLSIDLMRHSKQAPSGIMDKIFITLFEYGKENGYERFDIGMAPLANVGTSQYSFIEERAAHFIYEYGYSFYGFQGLRDYKDKYVSYWLPKYTAYRKRSSIVSTMLEVTSVVNSKRREQFRREISLSRFWS